MAMIFQDPMTVAEPGAHDRRPDLRGDQGPPGTERRAARERTMALLAARGCPVRGARVRPVPARVLRRHAPARDDRDGDRERPERPRRGRADDSARRHDPGADHRGAEGGAARDAGGDRPHHPRPRPDRRARRSRRRDVRGQGRRDRRRLLDLRLAPAPVHRRPSEEPRTARRGRRPARADRRAATQPDHAAAGLRVPPALRAVARPGDVQDGRAELRGGPRAGTDRHATSPRSSRRASQSGYP